MSKAHIKPESGNAETPELINSDIKQPVALDPRGKSTTPRSETPKPEYLKASPPTSNKRQKIQDIEDDIAPADPVHEIVGGSTVRRYLNKNVTVHLLDGLRELANTSPEDPLKFLGQFLIDRSESLKEANNGST
ncbi:COMPASS (complex proteins associated with Set1p) component [Yamadazyma tenuis]|uniref:COMPASS (complex proteins associated with Set1p) component n=1 Tax=Candida tenuis TaxID=2315449 RepID=UPI0027A9262C|nr:COMPASS (complex proteins associated with Set1p) component [Yamadazyma tenuis]